MMTIHEIETKIIEHLESAKCRSVTDPLLGMVCAYRGTSGAQCAVGCLIPDDHYNPDIEGVGISSLIISDDKWSSKRHYGFGGLLADTLNAIGIPTSAYEVLIAWQDRHDNEYNWDESGYIGPLDRVEGSES